MLTKEGYLDKKFIHPDLPITPIAQEYFKRMGNVPETNNLFKRKGINFDVLKEVIDGKLEAWRNYHKKMFESLEAPELWTPYKDKVMKVRPGATCERGEDGLYVVRDEGGEALSNYFKSNRKAWEDAFRRLKGKVIDITDTDSLINDF